MNDPDLARASRLHAAAVPAPTFRRAANSLLIEDCRRMARAGGITG
jgi:hypothetical protein